MRKTLKRRRHEQKTDYIKRIGLLKSGRPRIVFRKTNRYIISQYIESNEAQDKIGVSLTSKLLLDYGWPKEFSGSLKSLTAAYLTGLLMGKRISKKKSEPILDIGMIKNNHKGKVFAFLKGLKDSGVKIKSEEENFPSEDRIKGKHLKKDFSNLFNEIKSRIEKEK